MSANIQCTWETVKPMDETTNQAWESPTQLHESAHGSLSHYGGDLPCVLFEAKPSLEILSVSASVTDLLGVDIASVVHQPRFLSERVATEDRSPIMLPKRRKDKDTGLKP